MSDYGALILAEARLEAVRALADRWDREADAGEAATGHSLLIQSYRNQARELRAVLDGAA